MALQLDEDMEQLFKHSSEFDQGLGKERQGNNFVVSKDGSGDFATIQEAINAADTGATIQIKNGTYIEIIPLTLKSNIKIIGEGINTLIYFNMTAAATKIIDANAKVRIILRDFKVEVNNPSNFDQDCKFIDITTSTDILLENIFVDDGIGKTISLRGDPDDSIG